MRKFWLDQEVHDGERRGGVRRPLRLQAVGYLKDNHLRVPCTVLNISQTGASLLFEKGEDIPESFSIFLANDENMRRECVVVRRDGGRIGVRFRHR